MKTTAKLNSNTENKWNHDIIPYIFLLFCIAQVFSSRSKKIQMNDLGATVPPKVKNCNLQHKKNHTDKQVPAIYSTKKPHRQVPEYEQWHGWPCSTSSSWQSPSRSPSCRPHPAISWNTWCRPSSWHGTFRVKTHCTTSCHTMRQRRSCTEIAHRPAGRAELATMIINHHQSLWMLLSSVNQLPRGATERKGSPTLVGAMLNRNAQGRL